MNVRVFNSNGIAEFANYLHALRSNPRLDPPKWLCSDQSLSSEFVPLCPVLPGKLGDRMSVARFLHDELLPASHSGRIVADRGLWSWLSLFFFDDLCPLRPNGERKVKETVRYIPDFSDYKKYYRHLLAGPYRVYHAHRTNPQIATAVLHGPVSQISEFTEQFSAYQEIITSPAIMGAISRLYMTPDGKHKPGAKAKGTGSARRLVSILLQFDLTWDLHRMHIDDILKMLPGEFDRYRRA